MPRLETGGVMLGEKELMELLDLRACPPTPRAREKGSSMALVSYRETP